MQRDPWGRPIRGARFSNPWFDPPPARRQPPSDSLFDRFQAERAQPIAEPMVEPARVEAPPLPRATEPPQAPPPSAPAPIAGPRADVDKNDVRRAIAELEAQKERATREAKRSEEASRMKLVGELLPVLDDLDRSIAAGSSDKGLLQGVELVRQGLERVLAGYGLARIRSLNESFDPAVHEAIAIAPVTDPVRDGVVVDELGRGYRLGERVLRPAKVRVGQLVA
jgi:molecular chaperone GrpE